ncbi:MAG TPA: ATP-binding protein [Abditibacteriaceae bacterium]|nr:ATP-binding protein [Abditibacteriaceae bacterium]
MQMADKPRGALEVAIREDQMAGEVTVRVLDNGVGISPEVLPHIFESGFSTKRRNSEVAGTGLGLSICRRIIEDHKGSIWAEPRETDAGAMFCITLPVLGEPGA